MAELHPQVVHVTIILALVGVAFRLLSLTGRAAWASPAAAVLLIGAAVSSIPSVQSGIDAHGPVERVPGARPAVVEHEEWGERARNVLLVLGVIELLGLAMRNSPKVKLVHGAAAAIGLVAAFAVYEAGEHGGELVYSYAGGIGIRSGDPKDVERLLVAATYHQAQADRKAGRADDAAGLIAQTAKRFPADPEMQMFAAESLLLDQKNAQAPSTRSPAWRRPMATASSSAARPRCRPMPTKQPDRRTRRLRCSKRPSPPSRVRVCSSASTPSRAAARSSRAPRGSRPVPRPLYRRGRRNTSMIRGTRTLAGTALIALAAVVSVGAEQAAVRKSLMVPGNFKEAAPETYNVKFDTSIGEFVVKVTRAWAPNGADRFYNLVKNGFYDEARFFRAVPNFMVQFGLHANPTITRVWQSARIPPDKVTQSNKKGFITFAMGATPDTRTTQVFINFRNNTNLDSMGFAPFGEVVSGIEVVDKIYTGYGEGSPRGSGPPQARVAAEGNAYLTKSFPKMDFIKKATIEP
jgi:peptidyl-prolyl cis-trans isomerase A (cyclophilin A)